ncbi:hypothetical protein FOBRF1_003683 [Fusarium oxysporum]
MNFDLEQCQQEMIHKRAKVSTDTLALKATKIGNYRPKPATTINICAISKPALSQGISASRDGSCRVRPFLDYSCHRCRDFAVITDTTTFTTSYTKLGALLYNGQ